jgi:hypothetical protein
VDLVLGIIALFVAMVAALYARGLILRARISNSNFVYKNLKVLTSEGSNPGLMVYLISILTAIIGPFSYRLYPLNDLTYVIANIIAAIFFTVLYPPYSPVTGFATIDVVEREGVKYCIVGKVMNRKFRVLTINQRPEFEIVAESGRHRLVFEVTNQSSSQK